MPRRCSPPRPVHRRAASTHPRRTQPVSRSDDAAPQANPRTTPPRPHQRRTPPENRTDRRRRTPTPSLARRHLRRTTLLRLVVSSCCAVGFTILEPLRILGCPHCQVGAAGSASGIDLALAGRRVPSALHHI